MKKISACPSWLKLSPDRSSFIFLADRAEIIRKIFDLSIGGLGSYAIANYLNRNRVPPFGTSSSWDSSTIDSMLRNRATYGEYQPKSYAGGNKKGSPIGAPISNYYPRVIDEAIFQAAQVARQKNLVTGRGRKGESITNIFSGLITCAYCGDVGRLLRADNVNSLACARVVKSQGCIRAAWTYRSFEHAFLSFIIHPLFVARFHTDQRIQMDKLVALIHKMSERRDYSVRTEIASTLRHIVSELKIANAGSSPRPTFSEAIIRRDNPQRFFELRLWDGPSYQGRPIDY